MSSSFDIESFVSDPSARVLVSLKSTELTQLAERYSLSVTSGMKKGEIRQLIVNYLKEEELISDEEVEYPETGSVAFRKFKLQERAKE